MDIGEAIKAIQSGKSVRLPEWPKGKFIRRGESRGVNSIEWSSGVGFICGPDLLLSQRWEICFGSAKNASPKATSVSSDRTADRKPSQSSGSKPPARRVSGGVSLLRSAR